VKKISEYRHVASRSAALAMGLGLVAVCAVAQQTEETEERIRIAAASMEDAVVVDCQLPGKLRRLGGTRTYLTPGRLVRTSAIECRTRGGEYTLGDLASGTLSLERWMVPAADGDAEAQYYVARIYANGMDNVDIDYEQAARWYQMAADQGYAEAKQELGYLYEKGLGVPKDELKALNLQREASGLGEDLDYAYKIADAQALAERLATELSAANGALRDAQLSLRQTQDELSAAREGMRAQEVEMARVKAELEAARVAASSGSPERVGELEAEVERLTAAMQASQSQVLALEMERDTANAELSDRLANGQATQLELRELLARTEAAEADVSTLSAELAEAEQRLIRSDDELRRLQSSYREQSGQLATERARLLEARARTESDADAFVAASEAALASREAKIASLESRVEELQTALSEAAGADRETDLENQLALLQRRYDDETAALRAERDQLRQSQAMSEGERSALFAEARSKLTARDSALGAQKRQIATLVAESDRLRARVRTLEDEQAATARQSDLETARLRAELSMARQRATALRNDLDLAVTEKTAAESRLLEERMQLQEALASAEAGSQASIELLQAQIENAQSTINLQNLKIRALEDSLSNGVAQVAELKGQVDEPDLEVVSTEVRNAMEVLEMARSAEEPNLGTYHALLIANEDYEFYDDLSTPIRDVTEIRKLLEGRYGFNVRVLENATDDDIMGALQDYGNDLTESDNLLIYYSGRGSTPEDGKNRAYWLNVNADPSQNHTWLLAEHVSEKIRQIDAKRILVVTDSCFSRRRLQAKSMAVGRGMDAKKFRLLTGFKSRYVLTSGANYPFLDENGDRTHSMFSKQFMEILRQNSNVLSGEMLSYEMTYRLRQNAPNPDRATPAYSLLDGTGHEAGDFFFVPLPEPMLAASDAIGQDTV
jgi:chromosome segregation ATPase